jgi:deoxyribodipyrimidine photo-lyase
MRSAGDAIQVVWFKRDLRVADHRPLAEAASRGTVLPVYWVEDEVVQAPDFDPCHWVWVAGSLAELRDELARRGQPLVVRRGEAVELFEQLRRRFAIAHLWAHEETGNARTYARDRRVIRWARESGVPMTEIPQNGVVRRLKGRDGWSRIWEGRVNEPVASPPGRIEGVAVDPGPIPDLSDLGLGGNVRDSGWRPGLRAGQEALDSFLARRGRNYRAAMSSPVTGEEECSRLSPYLAYGNLSIRQVAQAARKQAASWREDPSGEARQWRDSLRSFDARLHWHCHFMQKLEDQPSIEFENFTRAFDGLRESEFRPERLEALLAGRTGYPFVDACMRYLAARGWINFRMRAMLASFAAYHLWLHWRPTAVAFARLYQDYEPGIHYSQFQMQSGTTGINTLRIYSPTKQGQDQDPDGAFVRRWVPELADVPARSLLEPWKAGGVPGYPDPIVDPVEAVRSARDRMAAVRRLTATRAEAKETMRRHGSRKRPARRSPAKAAQGNLFES